MRSPLSIVLLCLSLMAFSRQAPEAPTGAPAEATLSGAAATGQDSLQPISETFDASPLRGRAPEPRTMQAQWPVFGLFAVSWAGIMALLVLIGRRSRSIGRDVEKLEAER